jgi:lysozyme|tara:strand:- start:14 stop:451 length:438 start_codon:yes stop_codon:yes gene_type:complete
MIKERRKMVDMERLKKQLVIDEGLELKPYRCSADKLTIGVGRNIQEVGITEAEAMVLLENDIARVAGECTRAFDWFLGLTPIRKEAIINLVFNMGLSKFKQFKKTIAFIEAGDWERAGAELLDSNYARQVGQRSQRVANMLADQT